MVILNQFEVSSAHYDLLHGIFQAAAIFHFILSSVAPVIVSSSVLLVHTIFFYLEFPCPCIISSCSDKHFVYVHALLYLAEGTVLFSVMQLPPHLHVQSPLHKTPPVDCSGCTCLPCDWLASFLHMSDYFYWLSRLVKHLWIHLADFQLAKELRTVMTMAYHRIEEYFLWELITEILASTLTLCTIFLNSVHSWERRVSNLNVGLYSPISRIFPRGCWEHKVGCDVTLHPFPPIQGGTLGLDQIPTPTP